VAPQPGEVALLLAFVDDEECVGGGDRLGRLEGQVVGVARADPDDQKPPHRIKCARTAHTEMTPAETTLPKRSLPDGFARLGAAAERGGQWARVSSPSSGSAPTGGTGFRRRPVRRCGPRTC